MRIIRDRGFTEALNMTDGKCGVYCEGDHRKRCAIPYAAMNFPSARAMDAVTLYSALFDIAVNREKGYTANKQWVQPPWSIIISGVYIHALPIARCTPKDILDGGPSRAQWTIRSGHISS